MSRWIWPLGCALACLALGTASGLLTVGGGGSWYQSLVRPPGTPPPWIFGPVWSVLYLMMGVSLGRLVHRGAKLAILIFVLQFILNLAWTPLFFGMHAITSALVVIGLIWLGILATIRQARKVDGFSAVLLVPYWLWVSYASYLNAGFFWLNR